MKNGKDTIICLIVRSITGAGLDTGMQEELIHYLLLKKLI